VAVTGVIMTVKILYSYNVLHNAAYNVQFVADEPGARRKVMPTFSG